MAESASPPSTIKTRAVSIRRGPGLPLAPLNAALVCSRFKRVYSDK